MAIEGGVFTNLNKRNGYSFPPFMSQSQILTAMILKSSQSQNIVLQNLNLGQSISLQV